ncbi:cbb3-type cytochrome c oxidase subunit I [Marinobacter sp.]|uniref:cbb3-type cytochrome c oxidase subunit I n=1 Tax=Marinobacter sp. TaxID=50741 RepID=UPI002B4679D8|nr:cbb3-type cytochrome c oxidase subunit I [Marinobacter sp.]HKK55690.1 cbb3-type cytochrome c oxidase subunit I [Marinobacter sp.]
MTDQRSLPQPAQNPAPSHASRNGGVKGWLLLAVAALGLAALMAVLLVAARTPGIAGMLAGRIAFADALVLHVNFSILVWCLALAAALWCWFSPSRTLVGALPLGLAGSGALLMLLTPLLSGPGNAITSNYVPVLQQDAYLLGLGLFATGAVTAALRFLWTGRYWHWPESHQQTLRLGLASVALTVVVAALILVLALVKLPMDLAPASFYEQLFWGSGHVLQIAYAQLMALAWLWLARLGGMRPAVSPAVIASWQALGVLPVAMALLVALSGSPQDSSYFRAFTWMMMASGYWLLPLIAVLMVQLVTTVNTERNGARLALGISMALCVAGAVLGSLIRDDSLLVPAHYHAATGAVTIALMGLTFRLLPKLGGHPPGRRWQTLQLGIYGSGVALMAAGLAWSGGHGLARKTPGEPLNEAALGGMAMMGLGGLAAIMGVLLFVMLMWLALGSRQTMVVRRFSVHRPPTGDNADGS